MGEISFGIRGEIRVRSRGSIEGILVVFIPISASQTELNGQTINMGQHSTISTGCLSILSFLTFFSPFILVINFITVSNLKFSLYNRDKRNNQLQK